MTFQLHRALHVGADGKVSTNAERNYYSSHDYRAMQCLIDGSGAADRAPA